MPNFKLHIAKKKKPHKNPHKNTHPKPTPPKYKTKKHTTQTNKTTRTYNFWNAHIVL